MALRRFIRLYDIYSSLRQKGSFKASTQAMRRSGTSVSSAITSWIALGSSPAHVYQYTQNT